MDFASDVPETPRVILLSASPTTLPSSPTEVRKLLPQSSPLASRQELGPSSKVEFEAEQFASVSWPVSLAARGTPCKCFWEREEGWSLSWELGPGRLERDTSSQIALALFCLHCNIHSPHHSPHLSSLLSWWVGTHSQRAGISDFIYNIKMFKCQQSGVPTFQGRVPICFCLGI